MIPTTTLLAEAKIRYHVQTYLAYNLIDISMDFIYNNIFHVIFVYTKFIYIHINLKT